jgi:hypothetical protein
MYKYKLTRRIGYDTKEFLTKALKWDRENEDSHLLLESYTSVVEIVRALNVDAPAGNPVTQIKYGADHVWVE